MVSVVSPATPLSSLSSALPLSEIVSCQVLSALQNFGAHLSGDTVAAPAAGMDVASTPSASALMHRRRRIIPELLVMV